MESLPDLTELQVLSRAITVWGLELVPFGSMDERAAAARANPA